MDPMWPSAPCSKRPLNNVTAVHTNLLRVGRRQTQDACNIFLTCSTLRYAMRTSSYTVKEAAEAMWTQIATTHAVRPRCARERTSVSVPSKSDRYCRGWYLLRGALGDVRGLSCKDKLWNSNSVGRNFCPSLQQYNMSMEETFKGALSCCMPWSWRVHQRRRSCHSWHSQCSSVEVEEMPLYPQHSTVPKAMLRGLRQG